MKAAMMFNPGLCIDCLRDINVTLMLRKQPLLQTFNHTTTLEEGGCTAETWVGNFIFRAKGSNEKMLLVFSF